MNIGRVRHLAARFLRGVGVGILAGAGAGLFCGLCGRMVMRIVALVSGLGATWSTLGSLSLLMTTTLYSIPLGLLYVAVRRWVPGSGLRRGALFGTVMLLLLGYFTIIQELHLVIAELGLAASLLGATLVSSLFVVNGMVLETAVAWLRRERRGVSSAALA